MMAWHTGGTTEKTPLIGGGFQTIFNFFYPTLQRKFHLCILRKGIALPQSQFPHHLSVSDLYIPRIGPHIFLQQNRQTDCGNILISHRHMNETHTHISKTELVTSFSV